MDDLRKLIVDGHLESEDMKLRYMAHDQRSVRLEMQSCILLEELRKTENIQSETPEVVHPLPDNSRSNAQCLRC
ncbi:Helicase-like protein [Corchorus olitorius]|uniref:Helicase-like protein n=1 Tax=Corchorus olitorius TaxID=93759 RepID=A0A1R3KLM0_9ROSI|nr:Helicase-like protein [Corchorus olitorius]